MAGVPSPVTWPLDGAASLALQDGVFHLAVAVDTRVSCICRHRHVHMTGGSICRQEPSGELGSPRGVFFNHISCFCAIVNMNV